MNEQKHQELTDKELQELAEYYDNQTDEEAIAEIEAAYADPDSAMVQVPHEILPEVLKLIAAYDAKKLKKAPRK